MRRRVESQVPAQNVDAGRVEAGAVKPHVDTFIVLAIDGEQRQRRVRLADGAQGKPVADTDRHALGEYVARERASRRKRASCGGDRESNDGEDKATAAASTTAPSANHGMTELPRPDSDACLIKWHGHFQAMTVTSLNMAPKYVRRDFGFEHDRSTSCPGPRETRLPNSVRCCRT